MEVIRIGICVESSNFACAFSKALSRVSNNMIFEIVEDICEENKFDIVFSSHPLENIGHIQLINSTEDENLDAGGPYKIFKYKDSRQIVKDIIYIFYENTGRIIEYKGNNKCHLVAVASTGGKADSTAIAIAVGEILIRDFGKKIIYLNTCYCDSSKRYFPEMKPNNIRKLFYYLGMDKPFPISEFISCGNGMDYLNTMVINLWIEDIDFALMNKLLVKIMETAQYDYLFIDIGNCFTANNLHALKHSDTVLFVKERQYQMTMFNENLMNFIKNTMGDKNPMLINMMEEEEPVIEDDESFCISFDKKAFQYIDGYMKIDLNRNYGNEISHIAEAIEG